MRLDHKVRVFLQLDVAAQKVVVAEAARMGLWDPEHRPLTAPLGSVPVRLLPALGYDFGMMIPSGTITI